MKILSKLFKRKNKQIEEDEYEDVQEVKIFTDEERKLIQAKADVEAFYICKKIYSFFKEHINELKEGDNFILLKEEKHILDDKQPTIEQIYKSLSDYKKLCQQISELCSIFEENLKTQNGIVGIGKMYYVYTINISHDNIIELYDVIFRFKRSRKQINNGNEICVNVYGVDKNIYKII